MKKLRGLLLIVVAVFVLQLPVIGLFFQAANTFIHESGHALAALLTNGQVLHIHLFSNTEGITFASVSSGWGQFITGIAGYFFASFFSFVLAWLWHRGKVQVAVFCLFILALINLLFWMRNGYGIVWVIAFGAFLLWLLMTRNSSIRESCTFVLLVIVAIDSVRSALVIAAISLASPTQAGDAALLAQLTSIPAAVWGILFFVQALFFSGLAAVYLLSSPKLPLHIKQIAAH